jgi:S-adenosylmethionine:tRNA ribosyltransferase-isomerase
MNVADFDYDLPTDLIAQTPLEPRHSSRLMVVDRGTGAITHHHFMDIVDILTGGDILVANDSRVIPARLFGRKASGGKVEILLLKQTGELEWEALVGGKRMEPGVTVQLENVAVTARVVDNLGEARRLIAFDTPAEVWLPDAGHTPLPPYIHTLLEDDERYQTVFSRYDGSAAAPTAGLHFSPELLLSLRDKGVMLDYVTLHIGLDTFKPVAVNAVEAHQIHREYSRLTAETAHRINQTKLHGGRLVAVGTTAARTLETAALRSAGVGGCLSDASRMDAGICPWKPVVAIEEETDLFIYPGFTFRAVDVLLTNFHLPKSTLLMLVSAFAGRELILEAYQAAVAERYRFYSFGDAMLIL